MLESLNHIDTWLFYLINVRLANPATDFIMPILTNDWFLRILYVICISLLLWKGNTRLRWLVLTSVLVMAACDQLVSNFLKDFFGRIRPCHTLEDINLLVNCGAGKSMPSSHAANSFGQAVLFALAVPRFRWHLLVFAALIALTRVVCGVHYPGDIVVGALVGTIVGAVAYFFFRKYTLHLPIDAQEKESS